MPKPQITQDPMYILLREEKVQEFNAARKEGSACNLRGCDFKGLDLRELDAKQLDLANAYFRGADLRGIDFRSTNLEGASLANAKISGCYFHPRLTAQEIALSVEQGTRLRHTPLPQPPADTNTDQKKSN